MKIAPLFSLAPAAVYSMPLAAQAPLLHCWDIGHARARRVENDVVTSLVASLQPSPRLDGTPIPPSTMSARPSFSGAVFVQKQAPQINGDGDVRPQEAAMTWTLQATGEALSGTPRSALPMLPERSAPAAVTGTRRKE